MVVKRYFYRIAFAFQEKKVFHSTMEKKKAEDRHCYPPPVYYLFDYKIDHSFGNDNDFDQGFAF